MKKLVLLITLFIGLNIQAQIEYVNAAGLRGGLYNGISFKHFFNQKDAIEGLLTTRWRGFQATALMEHHKYFNNTDNFRWYYGYGAHLGFFDRYDILEHVKNVTVVGIDLLIGAEYKIPKVPILLSLDWKPYFNFIGYSGFIGDGGALSVRYIFN